MSENFLETLTGKKVNQDPIYKKRRRAGGALLAIALASAAVAYNQLMNRVVNSEPHLRQMTPGAIYGPRYREYTVQPGDSIEGITHKAYPSLEVGGAAFYQAAERIDEQLPVADQTIGHIEPGDQLALGKSAEIGELNKK